VIPAAGILPFGSIFIEMYFLFTAFWSYKFYYVYGFMLLVYTILTLVTICTTIVAVYFILNAENYHWQWIAFGSAGCTSVYVFLYSVFYFFYKTQMTGLLQVSFYFGYM
jgi:transmembrane 9 superfamily protein 3